MFLKSKLKYKIKINGIRQAIQDVGIFLEINQYHFRLYTSLFVNFYILLIASDDSL